jgi:hypothetical protein
MSNGLHFNQQDMLSTSQLLLLILVCVVLIAIWLWAQRKIRTRAFAPKGSSYQREALARGVFLHRFSLEGTEYRVLETAGQVLLLDKLEVASASVVPLASADVVSAVHHQGEHHG